MSSQWLMLIYYRGRKTKQLRLGTWLMADLEETDLLKVLFICCAHSIFGDTQKMSGHGAWQSALGHLVWAELDDVTSRGSSESELLSCSVTYVKKTKTNKHTPLKNPPQAKPNQTSHCKEKGDLIKWIVWCSFFTNFFGQYCLRLLC